MAALPIYAKVNKLEQLQNELAQIATYGIFAQRDNSINKGIFIDEKSCWN
jgi:hypothetical protein